MTSGSALLEEERDRLVAENVSFVCFSFRHMLLIGSVEMKSQSRSKLFTV